MPRRRPTPQQYRRRRVLALVVVLLLVGGVVLGARALLGGDDGGDQIAGAPGTGQSEAGSPVVTDPSTGGEPIGPNVTGGDGTVGSTASSETGDTEPSDPTAAVTEPSIPQVPDEAPTAESPATVYIAGDSDAGTFGPYLEELLSDTDVVRTELDYKVSSGLSRPDYFNWSERFAETLPEVQPTIVVVTFGGNDAQGLADTSGDFIVGQPDEDTQDWREEYGRRVGEAMDLLAGDGRTLIWVGIPNDDNPEVTARMQVQDEVVKEQAAERPEVVMIDTWERFSGRNGGWAEYVVDPRDGAGKDVRADDGFHLNEVGAEILALDIAEAIRADLEARGAEL